MLILTIIVLLCIYLTYDYKAEQFDNTDKRKIWIYWQLINGAMKPPEYIELCLNIMKKNGSRYFDVIILDEKTVFKYIPNLRNDINDLPIALKTDYIRVKLLQMYGGIWIDADTILMNNLFDIYTKLNKGIDFISFGCTGPICKSNDGYGRPSNGIIASQANGRLITNMLIALETKLNDYYKLSINQRKQFDYFELGKKIIWQEFDKLIKQDPTYSIEHISSEQDGTRDCSGKWIVPELIFNKNINYCNMDKLLVVMLANSIYCGNDKKYNWFCNMSISQILNNNYPISKLFKKAISYDPYK